MVFLYSTITTEITMTNFTENVFISHGYSIFITAERDLYFDEVLMEGNNGSNTTLAKVYGQFNNFNSAYNSNTLLGYFDLLSNFSLVNVTHSSVLCEEEEACFVYKSEGAKEVRISQLRMTSI